MTTIARAKIEGIVDARITALIQEGASRLDAHMVVEDVKRHWKEYYSIPVLTSGHRTLPFVVAAYYSSSEA